MSMRLAVIKAELKTSSRNSHSCNDASKGMFKGKPLNCFLEKSTLYCLNKRQTSYKILEKYYFPSVVSATGFTQTGV